jgi:hypothetical protein
MESNAPGVVDDYIVVTTEKRRIGRAARNRDVYPGRASVRRELRVVKVAGGKDIPGIVGGRGLYQGTAFRRIVGICVSVVASNDKCGRVPVETGVSGSRYLGLAPSG